MPLLAPPILQALQGMRGQAAPLQHLRQRHRVQQLPQAARLLGLQEPAVVRLDIVRLRMQHLTVAAQHDTTEAIWQLHMTLLHDAACAGCPAEQGP